MSGMSLVWAGWGWVRVVEGAQSERPGGVWAGLGTSGLQSGADTQPGNL